MEFNRWEILEADVPFEDSDKSKKRPVLILSPKEFYVLSLKMTSHEPRYKRLEGEFEVMKWKEAGLAKPTVIQCSKQLKLKKEMFTGKRFGRLNMTDIIQLREMLKYMHISMD